MVSLEKVLDYIYPVTQATGLSIKPYRILTIQNISKYTTKLIDYNNALGLLPFSTTENADKYCQTLPMQDIVFLGKILGIFVNHYFLSFDFGLIPANTPIPRYDQRVSDNYSSRLNLRAKELHISQSLANFSFYDLIFLDIPNTLQTLLNPAVLCNKATEIVNFTTNLYISPPLLGFNLQELKEMTKNCSFLPIQFGTNFKVIY